MAHVVEGSVQRGAEKVRVNAQLIDARTGAYLWAQNYHRPVHDVFAIQSEIAQKIADQLHSKLSPVEKAAMAEQPTADLKAYHFYTEAESIFVWGNWEGADESLAKKVDLLEKAIQRDPNFALAYCELAKTHLILGHPVRRKRQWTGHCSCVPIWAKLTASWPITISGMGI